MEPGGGEHACIEKVKEECQDKPLPKRENTELLLIRQQGLTRFHQLADLFLHKGISRDTLLGTFCDFVSCRSVIIDLGYSTR